MKLKNITLYIKKIHNILIAIMLISILFTPLIGIVNAEQNPPSDFNAKPISRNSISLSWVNNEDNNTYIEWHTSKPWDLGEGTLLYNGTNTDYNHIDLTAGTQFFYQAWSYNETDNLYSSTYQETDATTYPNQLPTQKNNYPFDNSVDIAITQPIVSISLEDPEGDSIDWTIQGQYLIDNALNDDSNGTKSASLLIPLPYNTEIIWFVNVTDGFGWTNATYSFTTRDQYVPNPPTSFTATTYNRTQIDLSWIKGDKADTTYIEWNIIDTWTKGQGTLLYNNTGIAFSHKNLNFNTQYFYQAWSWNNTDDTWSIISSSDGATTDPNIAPTITGENPADGSTGRNPLPILSVTVDDFDEDLLDVYWFSNSSGPWLLFATNIDVDTSGGPVSISKTNANFSSYSTKYWWSVHCFDGTDWINTTYSFTIRDQFVPNPPSNFIASTFNSSQINLIWIKGIKSDYTRIQRKIGSYPTSITDGTNVYNGTGTQYENTGLTEGITYFYRAWSFNITDNTWSTYASAYNTTNSKPTISNPVPESGSTGIGILPQMSITVNDITGDQMTIQWYSNSSGSWQIFGTNTTAINGTYHQINTNFSQYGKTYWWYVAVSDGKDTTTSNTFFFTINNKPTINSPLPVNGSANINPIPQLSITVEDIDDDLLIIKWYSNSSGPWNLFGSNINVAEGTYNQINTNFSEYNKTYWWYVTVDDGIDVNISGIYHFTIRAQYIPSSPSPFTATKFNRSQINLSWIAGNKADSTYLEWNTIETWTKGQGTLLYNGSGISISHTGLNYNTKYYYKAWSWNNTDKIWSTTSSSSNATTDPNIAPTISGEIPANNSQNILSNPILQVTVDDFEHDLLIVYWYSNVSGPWILFATNLDIDTSGGPVSISKTNTNFSNYSTKYWWSVRCFDGTYWTNKTFDFTRSPNYPPTMSNPNPGNGSTNLNPTPVCNVTVTDVNEDTITVYIFENTTRICDTLSYQVINDSDDAFYMNAPFNDDIYVILNHASAYKTMAGLRFRNVQIPQGATITSANLLTRYSGYYGDDAYCTIYGDDVNNSGIIEGGLSLPDRPLTTANILWQQDNLGSSWAESPDISSIIQEIIDRPGWKNGNNITIITNDTQLVKSLSIWDYQNPDHSKAAKLEITYITDITIWTLKQTNTNVLPGSNIVWNKFQNATEFNTTYWWSVNATDGVSWTNETYHFTTGEQYLPDQPTTFTATSVNSYQINLAWIKGSKADYTRIQRKTGNYPINIFDGTNVYNGTGSSTSDTGLSSSSTYYYGAWSWNATGGEWSSSYVTATATTDSEDGGAPPADIYVDDDANPSWYDSTHVRTIQEGINNASTGDTVFVFNGVYYEHITINKEITLTGEDKNTTIIDGGNSGHIIDISMDGVTFNDFTIRDSGIEGYESAVRIGGHNTNIIKNNIFFNCKTPIYLTDSWNNVVYNNYFEFPTGSQSGEGIRMESNCCYNIFHNNSFYVLNGSMYSFRLLYGCNYNIFENNTFNANGPSPSPFSDYNIIRFNYINGSIQIDKSDNNIIYGNTITKGIDTQYEGPANNNVIYHNNLIGENSSYMRDQYTNTWYNSAIQEGNYWAWYDEPSEGAWDNDSNGIVDSPYNIPGGSNQDLYPLMYPWGEESPVPQADIYVDDDNTAGPWDGTLEHPYQHIQDGVNVAVQGNTIFVFAGSYTESLINEPIPAFVEITQGIKLNGENQDTTFINCYGLGVGGVGIIVRSGDVTISGLTFRSDYQGAYGIYIQANLQNFLIENCTINMFWDAGLGILPPCSNIIIRNCTLNNNIGEGGIAIYGRSTNLEISGCTFYSNGCGLQANGLNYSIYHNNFVNNTINTFDSGLDTWYNPTLLEGNFYDDYIGVDANSDGIGDIPYNILAGINQDLYPLMNPLGAVELPPPPVYTYVDDDSTAGPWDGTLEHPYQHIQDAINQAVDGDYIFVFSGIYYENLNINRNHQTFIGEDKNTVIIDASGGGDGIIIGEHASNVISGFTIRNAGGNGVYIYDNINHGAQYDFSSYNKISNCIITNNGGNGVLIEASGYGSYIRFPIIMNCIISNNSGNGIYKHTNGNHCVIGMTLISNCSISSNLADGILQRAEYHHAGASGTVVIDCNLRNNSNYGIEMTMGGDCSNEGNLIYRNNFIGNGQNAYDPFSNSWFDNDIQEGNYWSDYIGIDSNGDGIGDTPYPISGSNQDLYPFMQPNGWELQPIACWHFDEGSGDIAHDSSGNNYNGTIQDGIWTDGISGHGLDFCGLYESGYVDFTSPVLNTAPYTVCLWAKPDSITDGYYYLITNGGQTSSYGFYILLNNFDEPSNPYGWNFGVRSIDGKVGYVGHAATSTDWVFLCGTWDGSADVDSVKFYINGILSSTDTPWLESSYPVPSNLIIGIPRHGGYYGFNGIMDEVCIYDRVLNSAEIQSLYNKYVTPTPPTADVYVDDDADSSWYDATHVKTIQEGINNATTGDTVFVYSGMYYENVVLSKDNIRLKGEDKNTTIIDADGIGNALYIAYHNDNQISNFTIRNAGENGVYIYGYSTDHSWLTENNTLNNCLITNNAGNGVYVHPTGYGCRIHDTKILNCGISDNGGNGIYLHAEGNHCSMGYSTNYTLILNCVIRNNTADGIRMFAEYHHSFISCTKVINCTIAGNNGYGIDVMPTPDCWNDAHIIYHDNFINNGQNAYDAYDLSINKWYDTESQEGNYWSDYSGVDADGDGIGDIPYNIPGGSNQDLYPFMEQNGWELQPIAYWNFDEGTGDVLHDISGNGNDGTIYGAQWTSGISDGGLYFDGDDDYVDIGDPPSLEFTDGLGNDKPFSISAWINLSDFSRVSTIISKYINSQATEWNLLYNINTVGGSGEFLNFHLYNSDESAALGRDGPFSSLDYQNIWTHVSLIYDGSKTNAGIKWYVNGIRIDNTDNNQYGIYTGISNTDAPVLIGARRSGDNLNLPFYGAMDEILIYNRALTFNEIQMLYNQYSNKQPTSNFTYTPTNPLNTSLIHFTDTSTDSDGSIVSWWWDFGDHYYSDLQNPIHCYYYDGLYTVNLTVTDNNGFKDLIQKTIAIPSIPSLNTFYVDDDNTAGPWDGTIEHPFQHIQDGINAANPGDTIFVYNGTYYENVKIQKSNINLIGEDKYNTIVDGNGGDGQGITIKENQHHNLISDLSVINATYSGIMVTSETAHSSATCNYNTIKNCIVHDCFGNHGIIIYAQRWTCHADYNVIENCIVYNISETPNIFGVGIMISAGDGTANAIGNKILNCTSYNNEYGLKFDGDGYSHDNIIENCTVYNNTIYGIYSQNNDEENHVYYNTIFNNNQNAYDTNIVTKWYTPLTQEGNYWSDYTGTDSNDDGIGDIPYNILGGSNQDLYPLGYFHPIANFTFTPSNPTTANTIQFTDQSLDPDGTVISWSWNFNDGNTSTLKNPTHKYNTSGNYNITLTVKDNDGKTNTSKKTINVTSLPPSEQLDQQQTNYNNKIATYSNYWNAQSFKPSLSTLTKVQLYVDKVGSPPNNLIISIRSSLTGTDLTNISKLPSQIPSTKSWVEFDFSDISVTPNSTYYIVLRTSGGTLYNAYEWGFGYYTPYTRGSFWRSTNSGSSWSEYTYYDFCFKTYGLTG